MERAEIIDLAKGITIQTDAVVSRTLLKHPAGSLTQFAFDRGQSLHEHTAPFDALVQVIEGEVELTIGGVPVRVKQGELVLMPAHIPHALLAVTPLKMLLTMVKV